MNIINLVNLAESVSIMAIHSLAPSYCNMQYTVDAFIHHHVFPVIIEALDGDTTILDTKDGGSVLWTAGIDAYVLVLKYMYPTANATIDFVDLYSMPTDEDAPVFVSNYPVNVAGGSASAYIPSAQALVTYRSSGGNLGKSMFLETIYAANQKIAPAALPAAIDAVVDYLISGDSIVFARDGSPLSTAIRMTTKTNDKLRKLRLGL